MAEEFPEQHQYFLHQNDQSPLQPPSQYQRNVGQLSSQHSHPMLTNIIDDRLIQQHRRFEREHHLQKAISNANRSYGSIYSAHSTILSENEPLINKTNVYQHPCSVYGEAIELSRYRRNQIFLAFYIIFYVTYLIMGSICFQRLEINHEQEIRAKFRVERQLFLQDYPSVKGSLNSTNLFLDIF